MARAHHIASKVPLPASPEHPRFKLQTKETETERRIKSILHFLEDNDRWVTLEELREHTGAPYEAVYYIVQTLKVLEYIEIGGQIQGRGRPKLVVHKLVEKSMKHLRTFRGADEGDFRGPRRRVYELEKAHREAQSAEAQQAIVAAETSQ